MPNAEPSLLDTVFCEAIAIEDFVARADFIKRSCGSNVELCQRVEALVAAHFQAGSFLDQPVNAVATVAHTHAIGHLRSDSASLTVGSTIGPYKLRELLGEGGMGSVFVAEQEKPVRRKVALKIIKLGMDCREVVSRFEAERQALAIMDHANIAKVLDAGTTHNGRPYFVMELVRGTPITEHCDANNLRTRERLSLFIQVCQAVQHAHQKGIIHRDLKPSNILVAMNDATPVIKVIDFGVAKAIGQQLTDHTIYTGFSQMVGTPLYMSPEQAGQSNVDIDTRSDIYSLGVLLYEVLTGYTPFDISTLKQAGPDEMRRIIRELEPLRPSAKISTIKNADLSKLAERRQMDPLKMCQHLRGELDWIVMKAIEKDRDRRYDSAAAFAEDIQRFLSDTPVSAGPPSTSYRVKKFIKRNRIALTSWVTTLLALLCVIASIIVYAWNAHNINRQLALAVTRAESSERRLLLETYADNIRISNVLRENAQLPLACDLLLDHRTEIDSHDARGFEWYYLLAASQRNLKKLPANKRGWAQVQFTSDGQSLVCVGRDNVLKRFDVATGQLQSDRNLNLGLPYLLNAIFSVDGSRLLCLAVDQATQTATRELSFWNTRNAECVQRLELHDVSHHQLICLSPNGKKVGYYSCPDRTSKAGEVRIWDSELQQNKPLPNQGLPLNVDCLSFSPDSMQIAFASRDSTKSFCVEIRDLVTGQCTTKSIAIDGNASSIYFAPSSQSIAIAVWKAGPPSVVVLDVATGDIQYRCEKLPGELVNIAFSSDGQQLAIATGIGPPSPISIWDVKSGLRLFESFVPDSGVGVLSFGLDSQKLAAGGVDGIIYLRDLHFSPVSDLRGMSGQEAWAVAFSKDSKTLAVGYDDEVHSDAETLKLWNVETGKEAANLIAHNSMVSDVRILSESLLASVGFDGSVCLWDLESKKIHTKFADHTSPIRSMASSHDGRWIAAASDDFRIRLFDTVERKEKLVLRGPIAQIHRLAISPTSTTLASADDSGGIRIWDFVSGKELAGFQDRTPVLGLCFSPDGKQLVFGNRDGEVRILDPSNTGTLPPLLGHKIAHEGEVKSITFSPDGRTMATGGEDGVRLWQWPTGKELLSFRGLSARVNSVAFSPDGQKLAAALHDGTVRIWFGPHN